MYYYYYYYYIPNTCQENYKNKGKNIIVDEFKLAKHNHGSFSTLQYDIQNLRAQASPTCCVRTIMTLFFAKRSYLNICD
jgi:hypothetical protein